jgi:pyridoxine 4-dehydrogenase
MAQVAIGWVRTLNQRSGMPRIIPLPGAISMERVEENLKDVLLDIQDMAAIDEIFAKMPIQGHRWPVFLQAFADK